MDMTLRELIDSVATYFTSLDVNVQSLDMMQRIGISLGIVYLFCLLSSKTAYRFYRDNAPLGSTQEKEAQFFGLAWVFAAPVMLVLCFLLLVAYGVYVGFVDYFIGTLRKWWLK